MTKDYKIVKLKSGEIDDNLAEWFHHCGQLLSFMYNIDYDPKHFNVRDFILTGHVWLCTRKGEPVGFLLATETCSIFDRSVESISQRLLYAKPNTRAAYWLLKEFIDFGRNNAKHINTVLGLMTNIKPDTLRKLGFKYVESLYRLEV